MESDIARDSNETNENSVENDTNSMKVPNRHDKEHPRTNQQNGANSLARYPRKQTAACLHNQPEIVGFLKISRGIGPSSEESEISTIMEYDNSIDHRLPDTVKLITTSEGVKVYLIGTAHYSQESQNDVKMIMQAVKPQAVLVELCKLRADILKFNDNTTKLAQNISYSYILDTIKNNGAYNGLFHLLLIYMTAKLSGQLDMLPGGEFRTAFEEAQKIPNCPVYLADRPLNVTIYRTVRSMSFYEMLRFFIMLMTVNTDVTKEEVEQQKNEKQVSEFEANLKAQFPALNEVFIRERDMYLSYMFQACIAHRTDIHGEMPRRVVGVVGLGHASGIIQNWGKVTTEDVQRLLSIPPEAQSTKILRFTFKATLIGAFAYMGYRYIPFPSSLRTFVIMEARSALDEYDHPLPGIMYTVHNVPGPGIDIEEFHSQYSLGCSCTNDCTKCSCVRDSPNYIEDKIVEEKLTVPIIECNPSCTCPITCGNRLVQSGPLDSLVIQEFGDKGFGLTTSKPIIRGQFICEYAGEVIGIEEARLRVERNKIEDSMNYVLVVSEHIGERTILTCIDPKYFGNIGRYCNHSCDPNAIMVPVRVEGPVPRLCLFASKDIGAGQEITFNYAGTANYSVHNQSNRPCLCGCTNCAGYLPHHPI